MLETRDLGFLPEGEIHHRAEGSTPYEMGHNNEAYDLESVFQIAQIAAGRDAESIPDLLDALRSEDSAVRFWGALGFLIRGIEVVRSHENELLLALKDDSPYVRAIAGEALGTFTDRNLDAVLRTLIDGSNMVEDGVFSAMYNLNALQMLGDKAVGVREEIKALPDTSPKQLGRFGGYVPRLLEKLNEDLNP